MTQTEDTAALPTHLPRKPRHGDTLEITIERLGDKGQGRASWPVTIGPQKLPRRFTLRVRKALPGEHVRVKVETVRKNVVQCGVLERLTPSSARVAPRCQHFGRRELPNKGCGGCAIQSLAYEDQLAIKQRTVGDHLTQAGVSLPEGVHVPRPLGAADPWYYRNKMEFSVGDDRTRTFAIGLHPAGWQREVLSLAECHIASPWIARLLPAVSAWCAEQGLAPFVHRRAEGFLRTLTWRQGKRTGEHMLELTTAPGDPVQTHQGPRPVAEIIDAFTTFVVELCQDIGAELGGSLTSLHWTQHVAIKGQRTRMESTLLHGSPVIHEAMNLPNGHTLRFEVHPRAFFQPNTLQAEVLYGEVIRAAGLREGGDARILDLYCGTGTIGLCLAPYAEHVTGVELVPDAVENARRNAEHNHLHNVTFIAGDAGEVLATTLADEAGRFDLVVVDPPRSGLMPAAIKHLGALNAPRLVYVSCNPKALARDLAILQADHRVVSVQPVDMFPHTAHLETVVLLERTRPHAPDADPEASR